MRLIFINRYYWPDESATSLMLTDLTQALAAAGHEVHVVTSRQLLENASAHLPARENHHGVHICRLVTTRFGRQKLASRAIDYLSFYISSLIHLLWKLRRDDVVVAKTDPPLISVIAALVVVLKSARLVNWLQDVYPEIAFRLGALHEGGSAARILRVLRNWSLRHAEANVVVGERMRHFVQKNIPGCAPVRVIHNWSQQLYAPEVPAEDAPLRAELGLGGKVVFCYSGNLGRAHEYETLLQASNLLRKRRDICFLLIGGGAQWLTMQQRVQALRLENWRFLPYQPRERLADSLGLADVHFVSLNPSLEGLIVPSKFYGILAAGRPTIFIGEERGEIACLLREYGCGTTVPPGDFAGLAERLSVLAADPELRRVQGRKAFAAHASVHQFSGALQRWLSCLQG